MWETNPKKPDVDSKRQGQHRNNFRWSCAHHGIMHPRVIQDLRKRHVEGREGGGRKRERRKGKETMNDKDPCKEPVGKFSHDLYVFGYWISSDEATVSYLIYGLSLI